MEKERVLGGEEGETKLRGRGGIVGVKINLTRLYLYLGYFQLIIYSIYLYPFYFLSNHYFN